MPSESFIATFHVTQSLLDTHSSANEGLTSMVPVNEAEQGDRNTIRPQDTIIQWTLGDTICVRHPDGTQSILSKDSTGGYAEVTESTSIQYERLQGIREPDFTPIPKGKLVITVQNPNERGEVMLEVKGPNEYLASPEPEKGGENVPLVYVHIATVQSSPKNLAEDCTFDFNTNYKAEMSKAQLQLKEAYRGGIRAEPIICVETWASKL